MVLSDRKKKILRAVVERYVNTAEPVGSKVIATECNLNVSSATIRNEMAELENMGLLEQPHTSAGRIPTAAGYRVYVNEIMEQHRLSTEDTEAINGMLQSEAHQLDRIITDAGRITSQLTHYPAYALATISQTVTISRFDLIFVDKNTFIIVALLSSEDVKNKLVHTHFTLDPVYLRKLATIFNARFTGIPEEEMTKSLISSAERSAGDEMGLVAVIAGFAIEVLISAKTRETHLAGTSHLLEHPEYQDIDKAQKILRYFSDGKELLKLPAPEISGNTKITIGLENLAEELKDSSVVVARYNAGENLEGIIGVVGPTRMDYPRVAARLSYIAQGLSWLLSGGFMLPGFDDKNGQK